MGKSRTGWRRSIIARGAATLMGIGFLTALVWMPVALSAAPASVGVGATTLRFDALALILAVLITGLSALIQSFAVRYLRADPRQLWFVAAANLLTGFTVLMVCAGSVAVFAVAWVGSGASLLLLLATYWPLDQARDGIRRTRIRFMIADSALIIAVVILLVTSGSDIALDRIGEVTARMPGPTQFAVSALLVVPALARSSQIPFHGWLPFTLAAPTPVSALMHAGVVNAGAILLFRFAPTIAQHQAVMIAIFLAGAFTLVYASSVRLVRADVKGRLVFSTMAQMGFMIMVCGLGLFAAAIFHLVAHALFKSTLFLGAGMGVREHAIARDLPAPQRYSRVTLAAALSVAVLVPAGALVAAKLALAPNLTAATIGLMAFVSLTATVALASALSTHFSAQTLAAGVAATAALACGYVAFLHAFTESLGPGVAVGAAPAWLLILPGLGLLAVQLLAANPRKLAWLRDRVFTRSLAASIARPTFSKGVSA